MEDRRRSGGGWQSAAALLALAAGLLAGAGDATAQRATIDLGGLFGAINRGVQQDAARDHWQKIDADVQRCVEQQLSLEHHRPVSIGDMTAGGVGPDHPSVAREVQGCTQQIASYRAQAQAAEQARQEAARREAQQQAEQQQQRQRAEEARRQAEEQKRQAAEQRKQAEEQRKLAEEKRRAEEQERLAVLEQAAKQLEALTVLGFEGPADAAIDARLREATKAYQQSQGLPPTGNLTPMRQAQLFADAAGARAQAALDAANAAEKGAGQQFARSDRAAPALAGDENDIVVLLNEDTPAYRAGKIVRTLDNKLTATVKISVAGLGRAAAPFCDDDGHRAVYRALDEHGMGPELAFPKAADNFSRAADVLLIPRAAFAEYPFLRLPGLRLELMEALAQKRLVPLFVIAAGDIGAGKTRQIAAEKDAPR